MLIIDTHTHAGKNWLEPIEILEFQMDRCGVSGAVLVQHGGTYDNEYLFASAARRPGGSRWWCWSIRRVPILSAT